jgi:hypothetical protein
VSLDTSSTVVSPIENEIPAYRAVSPLAVASLLMGLGSVFAFADLKFVIVGALAVVAGLYAARKIHRFPDILTGASLAKAGIGLGLAFSLSAVTFNFVREKQVEMAAARFAQTYAKALSSKDLALALWYRTPFAARKNKTPANMLAEMKKDADPHAQFEYLSGLETIVKKSADSGEPVEYLGLEDSGFDGLTPFAFALYEVHGTDDKGEHKHELIMVEMKSDPEAKNFAWYVSDVIYPYERSSHALTPKPVDDGHGHSH